MEKEREKERERERERDGTALLANVNSYSIVISVNGILIYFNYKRRILQKEAFDNVSK